MNAFMPLISGFCLVVVFISVLNGHNERFETIEKSGTIKDYIIKVVDKKDKKFAVVLTDDNTTYSIPYSCLNGTRQIGSSIELTVTQKIDTHMFIIETVKESVVSKSSNICIKY